MIHDYENIKHRRLSPPKQLRLGLQLGCIERLASQLCSNNLVITLDGEVMF